MKQRIKSALIALIAAASASPAHAVSQDDINRLFANPPAEHETGSINEYIERAAPKATPSSATLAALAPAAGVPQPQPSSALTTTNPTPALSRREANQQLNNMFDVSYADAEAAIGAAIAERGVADKTSALIDGRRNTAIFSYSQPIHVNTRGLQIDKERNRWSANLLFTTLDGDVISAIPAAGHYDEVMEMPVLKRAMKNGDIIAEGDVELRDFPANRNRPETITDLASLVGKTPLHSVSPFRPIRDVEIVNMPIIKRDAIVQISYSVPGMQITTNGQALAAGARGDVIEVRNTTSKKVVRAVVQNSQTVQVISQNIETSQLSQ